MGYINKIFVQYFNMIFRYALLQHESALHDGVLVRILLNMSVKHNMFFLQDLRELISLKNSTV